MADDTHALIKQGFVQAITRDLDFIEKRELAKRQLEAWTRVATDPAMAGVPTETKERMRAQMARETETTFRIEIAAKERGIDVQEIPGWAR